MLRQRGQVVIELGQRKMGRYDEAMDELREQVERRVGAVLTQDGKPVASVSVLKQDDEADSDRDALLDELLAMRATLSRPVTPEDLAAWKNEGRL